MSGPTSPEAPDREAFAVPQQTDTDSGFAELLGAVNPAMANPEALRGVLDMLDGLRMLPSSPRLREVASWRRSWLRSGPGRSLARG
jgi:hypothetical protein